MAFTVAMREHGRLKRHRRIRKRVVGTAEKPRLSVHRSHQNLFLQIIDDVKGETLVGISTQDPEFRKQVSYGGNLKAAAALGEVLAQRAKSKGITRIVFDRGGYLYHGRVRAVAEAARKGGLEF